MWVLENIIMKAHAKFEQASLIGNTQKSKGTASNENDHPYYLSLRQKFGLKIAHSTKL